MSLNIFLRSPEAKYDSISVEVPKTTTIHDLKVKISKIFDEHPPPNSQRLIAFGRLLKDEEELDKIFSNSCNSQHTVHVVFSYKFSYKTPDLKSKIPDYDESDIKKEYMDYLVDYYRNNTHLEPTASYPYYTNSVGINSFLIQNPISQVENFERRPQVSFFGRLCSTLLNLLTFIRSLIFIRPVNENDEGEAPRVDILELIFTIFRFFILTMVSNTAHKITFFLMLVMVYFWYVLLRTSINLFIAITCLLVFIIILYRWVGSIGNKTLKIKESDSSSNDLRLPQQPENQNRILGFFRASFGIIFAFFASLFPDNMIPAAVN